MDERDESLETISLSSAFPPLSVQWNVKADIWVYMYIALFDKRQVM